MPGKRRSVRVAYQAGLFLLNLLIAWVVTPILVSGAEHFHRFSSVSRVTRQLNFLNSVAALGLGYFVYRTWRLRSAKWVWVGGVVWIGYGALRFWSEPRTFSVLQEGHSIFWYMSGTGCSFDTRSCLEWLLYGVLFLRAIFYSAGAICSAAVTRWYLQRASRGRVAA
jgi:hypothetical protein